MLANAFAGEGVSASPWKHFAKTCFGKDLRLGNSFTMTPAMPERIGLLATERLQLPDCRGAAGGMAEDAGADNQDVGAGGEGARGGLGLDAAVHLQIAGGVVRLDQLPQPGDARRAFWQERLPAEARM